jgi:hypothetical protein
MIIQDIYTMLRNATDAITPMCAEIDKLQADIDSGKYSNEVNAKNIAKIADIRRAIRAKAAETLSDVKKAVAAHCDRLYALDDLRGDALTDDARLLSAGLKLTERDLIAILKRNADNPTMKQLVLRWANENNVDLRRYAQERGLPLETVVYVGHAQEIRDVEALIDTSMRFLDHWVDKPNAMDILNKFFGIG